jgi:hypothetical protein
MSRLRLRENAFAVAAAAIALLVVSWLAFSGSGYGDWGSEARPAMDALMGGHVAEFLQLAPVYGGSLILRAPFVMVTKLWHGGGFAMYRASAAPCLAATGALGVWLVARMRSRGSSTLARAVVLLLCVANPITFRALALGHPEEILGAVLCVAAVLCALHDRPAWAGVLLGLAIANKEWAVLAVGPMLVALPRARFRALLITGAVAGAVLAPFLLGASGGLVGQAEATGASTGPIFQPWQIWWFFGSHGPNLTGPHGAFTPGYRVPPGWLGSIGHTLVIALMPPLTLLYVRLGRDRLRRLPNHALLLLALLLALRCVLDPWDISYYSLPFLLALLTWEALTFKRPPVLALMASVAAWFIFQETSNPALHISEDVQALVFAIVSIPSVVALAVSVYAPGVGRLLARRRGPGHVVAAAPATAAI